MKLREGERFSFFNHAASVSIRKVGVNLQIISVNDTDYKLEVEIGVKDTSLGIPSFTTTLLPKAGTRVVTLVKALADNLVNEEDLLITVGVRPV